MTMGPLDIYFFALSFLTNGYHEQLVITEDHIKILASFLSELSPFLTPTIYTL